MSTTPMGGPGGQPFPPQQQFAPPPPQKKSNVLTWVLVGCGGFLMIGIIVVVAGGYFVWNKAKEAGIDPALMQKNPAQAVAKMLIAANPDIELVSTDDARGLITVKDKKTGKTVTINLDQARSGRITFKGDGPDEDLSVDLKTEGDSGSLEMKSKEGSAKFGTGSVDRLPSWLPVYPDVQIVGSYSAQGKDGESGGFHFATRDSPSKVVSFYEDALTRSGFTVNKNMLAQNGKTTGGIVSAEDSAKKRTAYINAVVGDDGSTEVTVVFASKQ